MARVRFIPFDQDAEDQKAEERAERRAMRKDHDAAVLPHLGPARFKGKDPQDPEYDSISEFVEFMLDNDESEYDFGDLNCLGYRTGLRLQVVKANLAEWGLRLQHRAHERSFRGFNSNPHDRWHGPGACPTHGGGGGDCIMGLAG